MPVKYHEIGHDQFLPHPLQFIIRQLSYNLTLYNRHRRETNETNKPRCPEDSLILRNISWPGCEIVESVGNTENTAKPIFKTQWSFPL
jgi:hypothetical protein